MTENVTRFFVIVNQWLFSSFLVVFIIYFYLEVMVKVNIIILYKTNEMHKNYCTNCNRFVIWNGVNKMVSKKIKKWIFNRYTALGIIALSVFSILITRLVFMQVVDTQYYKHKSNMDCTREISESAPRGEIVDRNGAVLAENNPSYDLTFMDTDNSKKEFFSTMEKVYKILDDRKEIQSDSFSLKINPYGFEFSTSDLDAIKTSELRFKKDRRLEGAIIDADKRTKGKSYNNLSKSQQDKVDAKLLKITPEETFKLLWDKYTSWYLDKRNKKISQETKDKIRNYTTEEQRKFMLVLDALEMQRASKYKPITITQNITRDTEFIFQEKAGELPGINTSQQSLRSYPNNDLASGVLGYISRINPDKKNTYEEKGYDINTDLVGVSGIEKAFESRLKGTNGIKKVEVNKSGKIVKEKAETQAYPGGTVHLTLSKDMQSVTEKALDKAMKKLQQNGSKGTDVDTTNATRGAVIVFDNKTGGVLASVSRPGFNPNLFSVPGKLTPELYQQYYNPDYETLARNYIRDRGLQNIGSNVGKTEDELLNLYFPVDASVQSDKSRRTDPYDIFPKPFLNYGLSSKLPPGSSFKPLTAVAGLEKGVIDPSTTYDDNGFYDDNSGDKPIPFPSDQPNGIVNLKSAIAKSSNPYFMEVGRKLKSSFGDDILAEYAWKYGLGVSHDSDMKPSTGIEISESFGQVFNTWSNDNLLASNYSLRTMQLLKVGNGHAGAKYQAVDLYDKSYDSKEVKKLKTKIKDSLKDSVKTGAFDKNSYKDSLKKLVSTDETYKDKAFNNRDYESILNEIKYVTLDEGHAQTRIKGNIYNAAIGQGMSTFTPLQLADYIATLVNGGNRYKAHLVSKVTDADGNVLEDYTKPVILNTTGVSQTTVDAVKEGMKGVTDKGGTAAETFEQFNSVMETGGKTGSATFREDQKDMGRTSYSYFVGFAPYDNPEITVCAVIFDGGYGASVAPVVKAVYEAYFKDELKSKGYVPSDDFMQDLYNK